MHACMQRTQHWCVCVHSIGGCVYCIGGCVHITLSSANGINGDTQWILNVYIALLVAFLCFFIFVIVADAHF